MKKALRLSLPLLVLLVATPVLRADETADEAIARAYEQAHQNKPKRGAKVLETYLTDHPKDEKRGKVRIVLSDLYRQAGDNDTAKAVLKKAIEEDEEVSSEAGWRYMNLMGFGFYMYADRTWGPSDTPEVMINLWAQRGDEKHPDTIPFELWKVDTEKLRKEWQEHPKQLEEILASPPKGSVEKVGSWEQDWPKENGQVTVKLKDAKGAGSFLVIAKPYGVPFRMPVIKAAHAIVVKRGDGQALVYATDRTSGAPMEGVELESFDGTKPVLLGKTGKDGCWEGKVETNGLVCSWKDGSLAASHSWWWGYYASGSLSTYFTTDRPIYRPGHTVKWKAVVRAHTPAGDYALPEKGKKFHVVVNDPQGGELWKGDLEPNAYGSIVGEVALKEGCPLGHYMVNLGTGAYGQFRVEEYRKPEYQVKVEAPAFVVQGDTLKAKVSAKYYFGAPVSNAKINWEIYRRPYWRPWWYMFPCNDVWFFEDEESPQRWYGWGYGNLVKQGTGDLAKDGTFSIECDVDKNTDPNQSRWQDESVTVVARVVDASRREEQGSAEVLAPRASFSLYAQTDRWVYRPGDEVTFTVKALDPDNKPRAGIALEATAEIREWKNRGYEVTKKVGTSSGTTDANGVATIKLSPDARGSLIVSIKAKDEKGRDVGTEGYVWLADELWASPTRENIECVADKRSYTAGDTAVVLCTMPQEKGVALVTHEREGILSHEVRTWEKGVLMLKQEVKETDMPNVYVTVTAVSGQLYVGQAELVVLPDKRLLDVTVSFDKEKYQPKEKAIVKIKAVERASRKPVQAEVAIGIVDASLYALATDMAGDIRKFFYKRRPHAVQTASSFEWWVQGRAGAGNALASTADSAAEKGGAPGAPAPMAARAKKAAEPGGLVEAEVRKDFPDTWAWNGTLETNAAGEATLELTVPDSLTTWRATARAITTDTAVGSAQSEATVFLPVLVRTETPRFLVQGDVGGVSAIVHNYLDKGKKTKISWSSSGPVTLGKPVVNGGELVDAGDSFVWVAIPSQGEVRLDWTQSKAEKPGKCELQVTAQTDEASDAMQAPAFPVLAHGAPRFAAWAGALEESDSETIKLEIPAGGIPEALMLDLSITPSIAATMLDSLESLAGYPYGCVEQTMSRFLPDVVAIDALRKLSYTDEKLSAELPKMIEKGIERLRGFQHGDGGWGWWEHDETHPYMTAYVVYGLTLARQADVKIDEGMYARGVAALQQLLKGKAKMAHGADKEDPNARAYMLFSLATAGKKVDDDLDELFEDRGRLDVYGKAVLARALWKSGKKEDAARVAKSIAAAANVSGASCSWDVDSHDHGWTSLDTETTAQALHALEETGEGKELWTKAVKWLVCHRKGHWWYSTKDTAMIVYVLCEHMQRTNELEADEDLSITVGDREVAKQHVDRTNVLATRVNVKLGAADLGGATTVTFKRSGKGLGYFAANLRTTTFQEDIPPSPGAVTVGRSIEVIHHDKDGTEHRFDLGKEPVSVGDELHVTLTINAGEIREYLLVEDPIPAGCEFVRDDLGGEQNKGAVPHRPIRGRHQPWMWDYWYCHREYRDDRLAVCSTWMMAKHDYTIDYTLRCERPGDFHVMPTRACDMYNPDVGGTGAENRLSIR